jgi:hypothetical protein
LLKPYGYIEDIYWHLVGDQSFANVKPFK